MPSRRALLALPATLAATLAAAPRAAMAQVGPGGFPARPLTILVPYGAGSTNDILARLLASGVSPRLGQPVVVDNRAGAGGTLGIGQVVRSTPDGYTLALVSASSIPINRALYRSAPFDAARDLKIVAVTSSSPNVLVVSAESPVRSLTGLVALGRRPGEALRYFTPGNGTSQHLSVVQLANLAGMGVENIPYRGFPEGITGLMAGETDFGFASVPSIVGLVRDGRLRALASTGPRPSALPGVPTLVSLGYPAFADTDVWYGLAAPAAIPEETRTVLREALQAAIAEPGLRDRLSAAGFDPVAPMGAAEGDAFLARQVDFWGALVNQSGATVD